MRRVVAAALFGIVSPAWSLGAQDSGAAPTTLIEPSAPSTLAVDGTRTREGSRRYAVRVTGEEGARDVGTHLIVVTETSFAGRPAWLLAEHRVGLPPNAPLVATDSVVLDRVTLAPWRWDAVAGGGRFVGAFANDSLYGGVTGPGIRRQIRIPAPPVTVTSEGALDALLAVVPLTRDWTGSVTLLAIDAGGARTLPLRLVVEGEERVSVPAGRFETLVVVARSGAVERRLWVEPRSGIVVRATMRDTSVGGVVERVLLPR